MASAVLQAACLPSLRLACFYFLSFSLYSFLISARCRRHPFFSTACVPSYHQFLTVRCWQWVGMLSGLLCRIALWLHCAWKDKGGQGMSITSPHQDWLGSGRGSVHAHKWLAWSSPYAFNIGADVEHRPWALTPCSPSLCPSALHTDYILGHAK